MYTRLALMMAFTAALNSSRFRISSVLRSFSISEWSTVETMSWSPKRLLATSMRWTEVSRLSTISCIAFCILG